MTIAEFSPAPSDGAADRTPPQDIAAEQSVLGAMLLSKDAIADVVEVVREADFYRPAHQTVFNSVTNLFAKGEPADAVTVANALTRSGDLGRIGGAAYLHTLVAGVPTAANAGYYAQIVRDRAVLRRLVNAGTRIVQWGYAGEGDVDQVVDRSQAEVFDVTSGRTSEDYLPLADIMDSAVTEIEGIASRGGEMVGVPTGFIDLDRLTNGLHPGQLIILAARPAIGKALALDTAIPTPSGWTTMGELAAGDSVLGVDGLPTAVVAATPVLHGRECFLVEFSDGASLVADADHEWVVAFDSDHAVVATTGQLHQHLADDPVAALPALPNTAAITLPERELLIDPYALGVWLATSPGHRLEPEVEMYLEGAGHTLTTFAAAAGERGITRRGFIPREFLRGSQRQRRDLLAGILDVAADVDSSGAVVCRTTSRPLAQDVYEVLTSLGLVPSVAGLPARDIASHPEIAVTFTSDERVFRLHDKHTEHKERWSHLDDGDSQRRFIAAITPVPSVPVRCIEVDHPTHLFLAGRSMIATHNSTLGLDIARSASVKHGLASVIFSLEMSRNEIVMRLLSAEAQVPLHNMRSGKMHDPEWRKIASRQGVLHEAPLFVDDSPNMTMTEIRAKCRRLKQRHDLRLVIVDYMQLMSSGKKVESRQQEVSEFSRSFKLLAKELGVPVIAISQLNRGPETRNDKKPMLSDLRESGCLTAETRVVRADTGAEVTVGDLFRAGERDVPVWSLDDSLRYRARTLTHVFATGHRDVFRLTTASGRMLHLTGNHPLLTYDGWRACADLAPGMRIAVARHVPAPLEVDAIDDDDAVLLAHLIGNGTFDGRRPVQYDAVGANNLSAFVTAARRRFGLVTVGDREPGAPATAVQLPAADWVTSLGLTGHQPCDRFVPAPLFAAPMQQICLFLRHLWANLGAIGVGPAGCSGVVRLTAESRRLVDDVARLLLRIGLVATVTALPADGEGGVFRLEVTEPADQLVFLRRIGGFGLRARGAAKLLASLESRPAVSDDDPPTDVWDDLRQALGESDEQPASASKPGKRLARVAAMLDDSQLDLMATNDVFWDQIAAIDPIGRQDVYDATVLGTHNFIANGVAVHNSLEQDADMVILIHREDAYDKESARIGEADLIVAKHRNGPTDTVTVAFQGHYSRFVDMARE
jgi:replicative DNA helicase